MRIENNDTYAQRAHIEALIEILFGIYNLEPIGKLGGSNTASWINDDVEYVELMYLGLEPDSDFKRELLDAEGPGVTMTYEQALELLKTRLNNSINMIIF